jgi:hypothetical protein
LDGCTTANALAGLGMPGNFYAVYTLGVTLLFGLSFDLRLVDLAAQKPGLVRHVPVSAPVILGKQSGRIFFDANLFLVREHLYKLVYVAGTVFVAIFVSQRSHRPRWARWLAWAWILFSAYMCVTDILGSYRRNF